MRTREMHLADVPDKWANGDPVTENDRIRIALLRIAGCHCDFPIIRQSIVWEGEREWHVNDGPRCKVCNTEVFFSPPTEKMTRARTHSSHRFTRKHLLERQLRGYVINDAFTDLIDCKDEYGCGSGCGCDVDDENLARLTEENATAK